VLYKLKNGPKRVQNAVRHHHPPHCRADVLVLRALARPSRRRALPLLRTLLMPRA